MADEVTRESLTVELKPLAIHFRDRFVFGTGRDGALTGSVLSGLGARKVVWVETTEKDADRQREIAESEGTADRCQILHHPDLRRLPFRNDAFPFVMLRSALQEIPRPRLAWLREFWRLVRPGGYLLVTGTPNRYFPTSEGRRGVGHGELLSPLRGAELRHESTRARHYLLGLLGLPPLLLDPEPRWFIHKPAEPVTVDRPEVRLPDTQR